MKRSKAFLMAALLMPQLTACSLVSSVSPAPRNATVDLRGPVSFHVSLPTGRSYDGTLARNSPTTTKLQRLIQDQAGKWKNESFVNYAYEISIHSDDTEVLLSPHLIIIAGKHQQIVSELPTGRFDDIKRDLIATEAAATN
jgi:hypothetical protein